MLSIRCCLNFCSFGKELSISRPHIAIMKGFFIEGVKNTEEEEENAGY